MGTIFDREHEPPEPGPEDAAYAVVKAVVGLVPGAADLLQLVIAPPLARRQQEWMNDVAASIRQLHTERGIRFEDLRENPAFIDAVLTASQAAIRTSQAAKREALRNAVLNSALPNAPDVAVQQIFIALVDRFTEHHLAILGLFRSPTEWQDANGRALSDYRNAIMGGLSQVIEEAFPDLRGQLGLYDQIWADLNAAGLLNTPSLHTTMSGHGLAAKRTTEFGDSFLDFITRPLDRPA